MRALVELAEQYSTAKLRSRGSPDSAQLLSSSLSPRQQLPYDPSSVFLLELMVSITSKAPHAIANTWFVTAHALAGHVHTLAL
jgi:golgi-specific brefeldin A-resistance guanine nucleotide exchange factor 1